MRIGFIPGVLGVLCTALSAHPQEADSGRNAGDGEYSGRASYGYRLGFF